MSVKTIGETISSLMAERGENRTTLARKTGLSRNTISAILTGRPARKVNLDLIAKALGRAGREELERLASGPSELTDEEKRHRAQRIGIVRGVLNLKSNTWLNVQIVSQRFNVSPTFLFEAAPICFALLAELSLSRRRARLVGLREQLQGIVGLYHLDQMVIGRDRIEDALSDEARSIAQRDLDGSSGKEVGQFEGPHLFADFINSLAQEAGLSSFEVSCDGIESIFQFAEIFPDDLERTTAGDHRARFALARRYADLGLLPVDLRYRDGEPLKTAELRRAWLAEQVPDQDWAEFESEMTEI